jgi:hypothetical protein
MGIKYQLRFERKNGDVDFAELPNGKWEWDSEEELRAEWSALMKYTKKRKARSYYITRAWGSWGSLDSDDSDDEEEEEWGYEIIWDSKDDE